jgi:hypothetical protein
VAGGHLSVKLCDRPSVLLLRNGPPRNAPLNLRCVKLGHGVRMWPNV